ncbi:hypothetical protein GCM10009623_30470 [Nocardioides aestuarii]|uniref:LysM peptidoglycan-binding domain-containing protein n=1 Tax=Nocardioides aestuarii TaxID=252231 RepID=A0ABW4TP49_9ACTN
MTFSGRPLAVATLATTLAAALLALLLPALVPTGPGFVPVLVAGCAAAGAVGTCWLWMLTLLVLLDVLRGRTVRDGVPRIVRRVVLAACGLSLAGSLAAPAYADAGSPGALSGLPLPDRTTTTTQWIGSLSRDAHETTPQDHARDRDPAGGEVRVSPGDTLWQLAEADLGAGAEPADVERRWRQIYAANRDVVGADPDLIRPGQRLALPATSDATRRG